jgi:hypothetical protein
VKITTDFKVSEEVYWNLIVFLHRHAIKIHDSVEQLWYILESFVRDGTVFKNPDDYQECTEQLLLLAKPLLHKGAPGLAFSKLKIAIKAAHVLSIIYSNTNLIDSCYYYALAEETVFSLFEPIDDVYSYSTKIGSLQQVRAKASEQQIATITAMIHEGYHYLHNHPDLEKLDSWLKSCTDIIQELKTYIKGKDPKRDKIVTNFYILVGRLCLIAQQDKPEMLKSCKYYFQRAFELDPQHSMAPAYLAFIQLYDSTISDKQRAAALKKLNKLANQHCPEACLILGNLYQPGAPALPKSLQVTQSEQTAQKYFSQAGAGIPYSDMPESQSSWFTSCSVL